MAKQKNIIVAISTVVTLAVVFTCVYKWKSVQQMQKQAVLQINDNNNKLNNQTRLQSQTPLSISQSTTNALLQSVNTKPIISDIEQTKTNSIQNGNTTKEVNKNVNVIENKALNYELYSRTKPNSINLSNGIYIPPSPTFTKNDLKNVSFVSTNREFLANKYKRYNLNANAIMQKSINEQQSELLAVYRKNQEDSKTPQKLDNKSLQMIAVLKKNQENAQKASLLILSQNTNNTNDIAKINNLYTDSANILNKNMTTQDFQTYKEKSAQLLKEYQSINQKNTQSLASGYNFEIYESDESPTINTSTSTHSNSRLPINTSTSNTRTEKPQEPNKTPIGAKNTSIQQNSSAFK